jgi:tetratricopeptide (TPR) repeat protein
MFKNLLPVFFVFALLQPANSQVNPLLQSGYDKLNKRNFEGAIQDFNRLILAKPDDVEAICGRADAKISLGNYADAMKDVDQVLNLDVNNGLACSLKGEAYFSQKDYENAQKYYNEALQKQNAPVQAIVGKSKVLNQLGKPKDAYKILEDAIDKQPASAELYFAHGMLNNSKEKYSKALDDFDKSESLNPDYNPFGVQLNRGISYMNLSEPENALKNFNKALKIDSTNVTLINSRGMVNYNLQNYKEAIADFQKMSELNPNNAVTLYNIGMAYNKMEDNNACFYFNKACQMGNSNACKMYILVCYKAKH